ncbi:hypothetical protein Ndes2526B_g07916 [Nannochloris sp. 'desiccata']
MRPPLSHRVHLGGGLIPLPGDSNKAQVGPLRASMAADAPSLEKQEPSKGENGTSWLLNAWKVLDFFSSGVVIMVGFALLVYVSHLGITHSDSVFEYLRRSEAGNVLTVTIGVLGFVARFFNNKLEQMRKESAESRKESAAEMMEMRKESAAEMMEMRKESAAEMRELRKESAVLTQAVNSLANQISTKFVEQDMNIQWMRGDYGVINRGHGPSNQGTKPPTDEPTEDEDSSATNT